jgi:hypothetical protein
MNCDDARFVLGALDVVFAFSLALERRGLLSRGEIVEALAQVEQQQLDQEGGPTARTAVCATMRQAFAMPVAGEQARRGWRVISSDDPVA